MNERIEDQALACVGCSGSVIGQGLREVLIAPWGEVPSRKGTFVLDDAAADAIVEAFDRHGTALVIDWEHQTLGGEYASPTGRAPAAGWIRKLWGAPGVGLKALVQWTEEARKAIRAKEYLYLSPTLWIRKSDRRAVELHSAALTNKPAIPRMERLAATDKRITELTSMADNPQDTAPSPETLLGEISAVLGIKASGDIIVALAAILDKVRQLTGGGKEDSEVASSVRALLDLPAGAGKDEVVLALTLRDTGAAAADRARVAEERIAHYTRINVLNPNNTQQMEAARALALSDPTRFEALLDDKSPYLPAGKTRPPPRPTGREALILKTAEQYRGDQSLQKTTSCAAFVNMALREDGQSELSDDEAREFAIA